MRMFTETVDIVFTFALHYVCIKFSFDWKGLLFGDYHTKAIKLGCCSLLRVQNEYFYPAYDELRVRVFSFRFFSSSEMANQFLFFIWISNWGETFTNE